MSSFGRKMSVEAAEKADQFLGRKEDSGFGKGEVEQ